jgi:uncharacterized membrane protein
MSEGSSPQPQLGGHESEGKPAAIAAWALYILSIPSAALLAVVGLIVAYAGRGSAQGVARQHIEAQIALFWSVFWWHVAAIIGIIVSIPLMVVGIGFITIIIFGLALFVLQIWFTVKSILGVIALVQDRPPI